MGQGGRFIKAAKEHAMSYASSYRRLYFKKYLHKYVTKVGKYAAKEGNKELGAYIDTQKELIVDTLAEILCSDDVDEYQFLIFGDGDVKRVYVEKIVRVLTEVTALPNTSDPEAPEAPTYDKSHELLVNIAEAAFNLRHDLVSVSHVAKTKLQEYWLDRTPPLLVLVGIVLALRLFIDVKKLRKGSDDLLIILAIIATGIGFFASFIMVYLRLPHAVDGAAKQKGSEWYIQNKMAAELLVVRLTRGRSAELVHKHVTVANELFNFSGRVRKQGCLSSSESNPDCAAEIESSIHDP